MKNGKIIVTAIFACMFIGGICFILNSNNIVLKQIRPKLVEIEAKREQKSMEDSIKSYKGNAFDEYYAKYKARVENGEPTIQYDENEKYDIVDDRLNSYIESQDYIENLISDYEKCGSIIAIIGGIGILLSVFKNE